MAGGRAGDNNRRDLHSDECIPLAPHGPLAQPLPPARVLGAAGPGSGRPRLPYLTANTHSSPLPQ